MSDNELILFQSLVRCARGYLEFGSGGSTCIAASLVNEWLISIDSSVAWLEKVRSVCGAKDVLTQPQLVHVDIGPTGDWGAPSDPATRRRWPDYHRNIWRERPESSDADLYMVDGRFRVACFMQILLHSRKDALVMIHDFDSRIDYHVVKEVARQIAIVEGLSVFQRREDRNDAHMRDILASYEYNPS